MSAALQSSLELLQNQEALGELLHSLSQPLTSLRCSLELSIDEVAEQQQATVSVALQQTEKVIGMIQLMREYLDAEQPGSEADPVALTPAVRAVGRRVVVDCRTGRDQVDTGGHVHCERPCARAAVAAGFAIPALHVDRSCAGGQRDRACAGRGLVRICAAGGMRKGRPAAG